MASDRVAAALLGVNLEGTIAATFFIASGLGGAAGVLTGIEYNSVRLDMGSAIELKGLAVIILGGMGSVTGAVVGGFVLGRGGDAGGGLRSLGMARRADLRGDVRHLVRAAGGTLRSARSAQRMTAALAHFYLQHSRLVDQIGINALLALSLSVSLRAGQLALAQAAFAGVAAYVSTIASMQYHWPLPASIALAIACAAAVAALLALPIRRLRGVFLAIATIGFGEILRVLANNLAITGGAEGISGIPSDAGAPQIYGVARRGRDRARALGAHQVRARHRR